MSSREMFHSWSLPMSFPLSTQATLIPRFARVAARKIPKVPAQKVQIYHAKKGMYYINPG